MESIKKKEFIAITFDLNNEIFIVYIICLTSSDFDIEVYPFSTASITF